MPERIPDKYSRAINFLAAVDTETFRKLERILEDAVSIHDADNYDLRKNRETLSPSRNQAEEAHLSHSNGKTTARHCFDTKKERKRVTRKGLGFEREEERGKA